MELNSGHDFYQTEKEIGKRDSGGMTGLVTKVEASWREDGGQRTEAQQECPGAAHFGTRETFLHLKSSIQMSPFL